MPSTCTSISRKHLPERSALFRSQQKIFRNTSSARTSCRRRFEEMRSPKANLGRLRELDISLNPFSIEVLVLLLSTCRGLIARRILQDPPCIHGGAEVAGKPRGIEFAEELSIATGSLLISRDSVEAESFVPHPDGRGFSILD